MENNINKLIDFTKEEKNKILSNTSFNNVQKFANDNLTLEECLNNINELINGNNEITLDDILEIKLNKEFKDFEDSLKLKSPDEILKYSYEYVCKEELKEELLFSNLDDKEKAILIDQDELLQELYNDWLDVDIALGESLRPSLEDSILSLTRYYGKQNKFRIEDIEK